MASVSLKGIWSYSCNWPFQGNHNANVALSENEFGTPGVEDLNQRDNIAHDVLSLAYANQTEVMISSARLWLHGEYLVGKHCVYFVFSCDFVTILENCENRKIQ